MAVLIVLGAGLGGELLERAVVARSQPVVSPDLRDADDALRAGSVRAVAAASMALQLVVVSVYVWAIGATATAPWLRAVMAGVGLALMVAAVGTWGVVARPSRRPAVTVGP